MVADRPENERGGKVSKCTTHHHACDCQEEATRKLVEKLLFYCEFVCSKAEIDPMYAEAVRLGYVQGQAAKPAPQGEGEG